MLNVNNNSILAAHRLTTPNSVKKSEKPTSEKYINRLSTGNCKKIKSSKLVSNQKEFKKIEEVLKKTIKPIAAFNQQTLINDTKLPANLKSLVKKYNGLCELICNQILIDGKILGKGYDDDFLPNKITIETLNQKPIIKSHIISVFSIFEKMIAFIFQIYPNNLFSIKDQFSLVDKKTNEINKTILSKGLDELEVDVILKLEVLKKEGLSFSGHSLLIKKSENNQYVFFDPDEGEYVLSFNQLIIKINEVISSYEATDVFFLKADQFLKKLKNKKIIDLTSKM